MNRTVLAVGVFILIAVVGILFLNQWRSGLIDGNRRHQRRAVAILGHGWLHGLGRSRAGAAS